VTDQTSAAQSFIDEAASLWRYDGMFYHVHLDGQDVGAFCIDDIGEDEEVMLSLIKVKRGMTGGGIGRRMLNMFCELADRHCVAIQVEIVPTGDMSEDEIISWYVRNGFEALDPTPFSEGPRMSRSPQDAPELADDLDI